VALPDPATRAGAAGLAALLAEPARALLCCDYDGTLAPIVLHPADAAADPAAVAALNRLAGQLARVVVLTGRPAEVAVRLGGLAAVPRLLVLGHYGLERWYDGRLASPEPDPGVARARARLPALPPGVTVEDKRLSFVVHTRPAPDPAATLAGLDGPLRALAAAEGLEVVDGSYARELRPRGTDKGSALLALAEEFQPSAVLAVGDDDGDLPVLDAVATLRAGGLPGLVVCVARPGGSEALRQRADLVVEGVAGVAAFLDSLSAAIGSAA
jgi:trehalose 6-phosphate phosphatase